MSTFLMDPECEIRFAKIPSGLPKRFIDAAYSILWQYWLEHCAKGPTTEDRAYYAAAVKRIQAKQEGWCSQHDISEAGFIPMGDMRRMVPQSVVDETFKKIIDAETV